MNKKVKVLYSILILGLCWSVLYLIPFIQYVFYDPFKEMLGCTNGQLGMLMTIYGLGNFYGCPIGGWIADRFNYKKVYVASLLVNAVLGFIFVLKPTYSVALVMWVGFSIASLIMNYPAHIKIVRGLVSDEDQGKIFGINETCIGIGNIIFNAIMMFLFAHFLKGTNGIKAAILGLCVISVILSAAAWFVIDDPYKNNNEKGDNEEEEAKMTMSDYVSIIKNPRTWLIAVSIFSVYSFLTTMSYFTPYFTEVLGVSVTFSGVVAIIRTYVMTLVGAPIGGLLTDKLKSPSKVLFGVNVIGVIALIILLNLSKSTPISVLIVLTLGMALMVYIGRGAYYAVITELKVPKKYTASTIGIAAALGFSPDIFQFLLFGKWLDQYKSVGYTYMFMYQLVVLVIGAIVALTVLKIKNRVNVGDKTIEEVNILES